MSDEHGYVVFFYPQALETLGDPIKPYLQGAAGNEYVLCREIDTAGAFIEMTLSGQTQDGRTVQIEVLVPNAMVRMIVSARGDEQFGFRPRFEIGAASPTPSLPPVGPTAEPAQAPTKVTPPANDEPTHTPQKP